MPPHTPTSGDWPHPAVRHGRRTGQPWHTSMPWSVDPRDGNQPVGTLASTDGAGVPRRATYHVEQVVERRHQLGGVTCVVGEQIVAGPLVHAHLLWVEGVRFHDLRHTYASTLLAGGVSVPATAEYLGHSPVVPADHDRARAVVEAAYSTPRVPGVSSGG